MVETEWACHSLLKELDDRRIDRLRLFLAVAELGSVTAGGRRLDKFVAERSAADPLLAI